MPKYRYGEIESEDQVGIVTGLAWTDVGGELLTIEGVMMPGKGKMRSRQSPRRDEGVDFGGGVLCPLASRRLRHRAAAFDRRDIHVHVPEGATPKDGPSAGVAMATAIVSVLTGIPVRHDVAMTGEITLRGRVLPIGGLKEKLLAAARGGIKTVMIPEDNAKDLTEIPKDQGRDEHHPGRSARRSRLQGAGAAARADVWEEDTKVPVRRTPATKPPVA